MANQVFIATSLDGYIATKDGGLEWLQEIDNPDGSDFGFGDFISGIDALVMGRNTYEKVLSFGLDSWPYQPPVFVVSNSDIEIPGELSDRVNRITGAPGELVGQLNGLGYKNLYIDGGLTIQGFLEADIIDYMTITRIPILLGEGIPLFGKLNREMKFTHLETKVHANQLVMSRYERTR